MARLTSSILTGAILLASLAGCDDGIGVGGAQSVTFNFQVNGPSAAPVSASVVDGWAAVAGPPMVLVGTNGTLTLDEIRVIISEIELEGVDGRCPADEDDAGDGCEEFEGGPRFLDLPLDGQPIEVATELVPSGTYDELEFQIEDLEMDEGDPAEEVLIAQLRAEIRALVPDWPDEATVLITGSFAPNSGTPRDFRVFVAAEIDVTFHLSPALVMEDGAASRALTVQINPEMWSDSLDGAVIDLSEYDYDTTNEVLEFDSEFADAFSEIEID